MATSSQQQQQVNIADEQQQQQQQQQLPPHSDNVDEELRRVHLALSAVFSIVQPPPPNAPHQTPEQQQWFQQRKLADKYLTSFQSTQVSWMVCDRLLQQQQQQETDAQATSSQAAADLYQRRFFAAQTLHTKCRSEAHVLPNESLPSLRDSLIRHLHRYTCTNEGPGASSSTALTTRLALCISSLAVQMNWTTIITDLLVSPQNQNQPQQHNPPQVVLPILLVLPEECASDRLLLQDENARFRMRDHLVQSAPLVLQFLYTYDPQLQHKITLEVLLSWIRYVPIQPTALVQSPLLPACVQVLLNPNNSSNSNLLLLESAADVVVEVLRMYPSHMYDNQGLVQVMIPLLSQLPLEQALQQQQQQQQSSSITHNNNNEDVLRTYCRIITEMGESYMSWILSREYVQASQLVNWVLQCSSILDVEIASITLHFWYRMVMDLECIEPYQWRQELIDVYTPHLLHLLDICVKSLMKYPADIDIDDNDQIMDDINRHRFYVSETIEDCCRLLGGQAVLQRMCVLFQKERTTYSAAAAAAANNAAASTATWQGMESCLASVAAIHRFVPSDENELLPQCFDLIPHLPPTIRPLRFTASKLIGKFAYWLAMHSNLLQPLLPYLRDGLYIPECAPAAARAIKELCECSNNQNFAIAEPVLQLYEEITAMTTTTITTGQHQQQQPSLSRLELADELQILEGVCRALTRHTQETQHGGDPTPFLERLVSPIGSRLAAAVADPNAGSSPRHVVPELDRLTVILQYLKIPPTSIVELMSSMWPLLETATNRFGSNFVVAEKICRLHKHALRSAGAKNYAPVLDPLITQLVKSYDQTRQSPFLYAASICVTEYGNDLAYTQRLLDMVEAMSRTTFSFLRTLEDFTNHPDVVEEYFYLMQRVMTHCPDQFVTSPLLLSAFQCSIVGMRIDHHGANNGTLKFLESTISYGLSLREQNKPECQAALERALSQEGQAIVNNLALALMGDLPSYSKVIPGILWKLNLLCPGLLAQWLKTAFESAAAAVSLPERAKNDFMGALNTGLARDEFSLAVRGFQSACERERRFRKIPSQIRIA